MSSARDNRQRAAARARLEREMAARLEAAAKRRRLVRAVLGGTVAGLVVIGAVIWIISAVSGSSGTTPAAAPTGCVYRPAPTNPPGSSDSASPSAAPTSASPSPKPASTTGQPAGTASVSPSPTIGALPDTNPPRSGYRTMTIGTNLGTIKIEMNLAKAPCTAASMAHLAQTGFFLPKPNSGSSASCHRLVTSIFVLQCGDPTGTGSGGPGYEFDDENLQPDTLPAYHEGDVAMANSGADTNGSQFFFVYQTTSLPGKYSLWGHVIEGLDIVKKIAAGGDDDAFDQQQTGSGDGHPLSPLIFKSVEVGPVYQTSLVTAAPAPTATPSASASATASSTPTASSAS
jgi:peptidyl-prolyl cis-trans isomerase B (cyclophilin B)